MKVIHFPEKEKEIKGIADTIIWLAKERMKEGEPYQNINSAIHGIMLDVKQYVMNFMREAK